MSRKYPNKLRGICLLYSSCALFSSRICIFVPEGHFHQILTYCVAFNSVRVASGGLDSTVRVWDAGMGVRTLSMFFLIIILTGFLYDYRMSSSSSMPSANLELSPTGTTLATAVPTGD